MQPGSRRPGNLADGGATKRVALLVLNPSMARTARAVPAVLRYAPMTLAELGRWLGRHRDDRQRCLRYCFEFLDEYRDASPEDRRSLLSRESRPTGEPRWDAFLAALGEHLAFHEGTTIRLDAPPHAVPAQRVVSLHPAFGAGRSVLRVAARLQATGHLRHRRLLCPSVTGSCPVRRSCPRSTRSRRGSPGAGCGPRSTSTAARAWSSSSTRD